MTSSKRFRAFRTAPAWMAPVAAAALLLLASVTPSIAAGNSIGRAGEKQQQNPQPPLLRGSGNSIGRSLSSGMVIGHLTFPPTECPVGMPAIAASCADFEPGTACHYGYFYQGNTWDDLRCAPSQTCTCTVTSGPGIEYYDRSSVGQSSQGQSSSSSRQGESGPALRWVCRFHPVPHVIAPELLVEEPPGPGGVAEASANAKLAVASMPGLAEFPRGDCDPSLPLPPPPPDDTGNCPIVAPGVGFGDVSCSEYGYPVGETCNYRSVYTGCSWDALRCSSTQKCTCTSEGTFACAMAGMEFCPDRPEDLPWGDACDPNAALPTPFGSDDDGTIDSGNGNSTEIDWEEFEEAGFENETIVVVEEEEEVETVTEEDDVEVVEDEDIDGRRPFLDECPEVPEFGSCANYEPGTTCGYNHMYTGCTWKSLSCTAIMSCSCGRYGDQTWACMSFAMMPCETKPEGHPAFQRCDPDDPLPWPRPQDDAAAATTARLSPLLEGGQVP